MHRGCVQEGLATADERIRVLIADGVDPNGERTLLQQLRDASSFLPQYKENIVNRMPGSLGRASANRVGCTWRKAGGNITMMMTCEERGILAVMSAGLGQLVMACTWRSSLDSGCIVNLESNVSRFCENLQALISVVLNEFFSALNSTSAALLNRNSRGFHAIVLRKGSNRHPRSSYRLTPSASLSSPFSFLSFSTLRSSPAAYSP